MSRVDSVSSIKNGKRSLIRNDVPEEGTKVRELYDYFLRYRGIPIPFVRARSFRSVLRCLQDDYGLDIRCIKRGIWVLAGEWKGGVYVDYIAPIVK